MCVCVRIFVVYLQDHIVIQPVDQPTSLDGSTQWIVRDINLFTTTVIYSYTNETATLSNGSIANSRVMNGARSLPAILYVKLKFSVDTSFEKIEIFREALSQYVDKRPREWVKLYKITNLNVQADQGYVDYLISFQHVHNWQQLDTLAHSRSQAKYFCHELSKQLEIRYTSPPLPVDLRIQRSSHDDAAELLLPVEEGRDMENIFIPSVAQMSAESDQIRNLIRDRRM